MEHVHPVVHATEPETKRKPVLTLTQTALLTPTGIATALVILWPAGHQIYGFRWDYPGLWWVLLLLTLAGWIMVLHELGAEKSRENQRAIIENQGEILAELAELRAEMEGYGDQRERAGHALATAIRNGNGTARLLHPVD